MNVPVRDLKNRLSAYLQLVQKGEHLVVTDRGKPVAEVLPVRGRVMSSEERLQQLADRGEVRLARRRRVADFEPVQVRGRPVSQTLLEDREPG
ncbi:MAG: type II toxin-antitoxin system prevent-host-death family antitoxin [Deltaproteobacteria bacterium]|nr:type II toxin-antitoxin system prevent-host-death family antitoxin [Deltaproteobacteria bacterium]